MKLRHPLLIQTLVFVGKVRLKGIFGGENAFIWNIIRLILLIFVAAAGWTYGFLYDAVLKSENLPFDARMLEAGLHGMALMVVFLVNYVPSFRPRSEYLHVLYPISLRFRTTINFYGDMLNLIYAYTLVFIGMMVVGGSLFGVWQGVNAMLFLTMVIVLERGVKVYLEHFVPRMGIHVALSGLMGALVAGYLVYGIPFGEWRIAGQSLFFGIMILAGLAHYYTLADIAGARRTKKEVRRSRRELPNIAAFATYLYLKRKATLFTIFMIVVSKVFVVAYAMFFMDSWNLEGILPEAGGGPGLAPGAGSEPVSGIMAGSGVDTGAGGGIEAGIGEETGIGADANSSTAIDTGIGANSGIETIGSPTPTPTAPLSLYYVITLMLPIIPFSYVHNNWAGFFRESWLGIQLQSGSERVLLKAWLGSLIPFLFFDLALTAIVISVLGFWSTDLALYFALCISLFLPLGLMASIHHPRYIDRLFTTQNIARFKNNSSALYMLYFLFIIVGMSIALQAGILAYASVPILLLSVVLWLYLPRFWENNRHKIYDTLFCKE
jgi:hypothetical protein